MRTMILLICFALTAVTCLADGAAFHSSPEFSPSLRERAVGDARAHQTQRPTGQCIYECDDRLISLKRCSDGDCPEYDCRTGTVTCRSR